MLREKEDIWAELMFPSPAEVPDPAHLLRLVGLVVAVKIEVADPLPVDTLLPVLALKLLRFATLVILRLTAAVLHQQL